MSIYSLKYFPSQSVGQATIGIRLKKHVNFRTIHDRGLIYFEDSPDKCAVHLFYKYFACLSVGYKRHKHKKFNFRERVLNLEENVCLLN